MFKEVNIDVKWFGQQASEIVMQTAMKGLKKCGEVAAGEAMREAPVLSGTLKRSICVSEGGVPDLEQMHNKAISEKNRKDPIVVDPKVGEEVAIYVTANTPYAHKQHEENKVHSKYLERGLQKAEKKFQKIMQMQFKKMK